MSNILRGFRIAFAGVVAITIIVLLLYGVGDALFGNRDFSSPNEIIRQRTEDILQKAKYPLPTNATTPQTLEFGACGNWLPEVLRRNNNHYSVNIVGIWGDGASPIPGGIGSITATVQVVFPDGTRIELQYYAYTLDICRVVQTGDQQF